MDVNICNTSYKYSPEQTWELSYLTAVHHYHPSTSCTECVVSPSSVSHPIVGCVPCVYILVIVALSTHPTRTWLIIFVWCHYWTFQCCNYTFRRTQFIFFPIFGTDYIIFSIFRYHSVSVTMYDRWCWLILWIET